MSRPTGAVELDLFLAMDQRLAEAGMHGLSPFWNETVRRFYTSGVGSLVARVGRGGAKSFSSCKFAVYETCFREWKIPPGERHYFLFVSALKSEVTERRTLLERMLRSLGIPFETAGDVIRLSDRPLGFRFAASDVNAVSGYRSIGYVADELAKWAWDVDAADPASEVLTSLEAQCNTHRGYRRWCISSPWGIDDAHAQLFDQGDTATQITAYAASWDANPEGTLSRAERLLKCGGPTREFKREYEAIPATTESAALDHEDLSAAFERHGEDEPRGEVFCAIDSSAGRQDSFAWAVFSQTTEGGLAMLKVASVEAFERLSLDEKVARVQADCEAFGATRVFGDQYGKGFIEDTFGRAGLQIECLDWSLQSKQAAMGVLRKLLREKALSVPPDQRLKSELFNLQAVLSPFGAGAEKFKLNGRDYAATLVTACLAVQLGRVSIEAVELGAYAGQLGRAFASGEARASTLETLALLGGASPDDPHFKAYTRALRDDAAAEKLKAMPTDGLCRWLD